MPKTNEAALDAFVATKADIDIMLERLAAFSADHFDCSPEDVHWGHVGTLDQVDQLADVHRKRRSLADEECWLQTVLGEANGPVLTKGRPPRLGWLRCAMPGCSHRPLP